MVAVLSSSWATACWRSLPALSDIHGDGVNVAARLEGLAKPGGICVSGNVYEEVRDRTDLPFEDMGEREVKNIDRPVRVWQWVADGAAVTVDATKASKPLPLPDKASIAVLPLDNMSESRNYEYLADGITEDIITLLARIPGFFVIARNSTFSYKGQPHDIRQVGRELGVRYVVEGSLRPIGDRLRVTIQLIEAESGNHVWAERFDRAAADLFDVQDEITNAIVARLEPELTRAEFELIRRRPPADMDAWDYYRQASGILSMKGWHERTFAEGAELYRKAIALDPEFAPAHAALSLLLAIGHMIGYVTEPDEALAEADQALTLDSGSSEVLGFAGCALSDLGHTTRGIELLERAIERDPSNAQAWVALGAALLTDQSAGCLGWNLCTRPRLCWASRRRHRAGARRLPSR
jgi:adenylate cyclase